METGEKKLQHHLINYSYSREKCDPKNNIALKVNFSEYLEQL